MKKYARGVALPTLLAAALALASCGGSGAGGDDMRGMEHGSGSTQGETTGGMAGMNHEGMASGEMAREMLYDENGEYSDVRFVDSMTPHHEGAVEMAEVALENAEHEEIKDLAGDIISAQTAEIEILGEIRAELDAGPKMEVGDEDMQMMGMVDSRELARQRPFDRAFMDAMIPHHESAVAMANVALAESENPRIKTLAEDIVGAQRREIGQMENWCERWYPES